MKSPESTAYEGGVELEPYASLDSLYLSILKEAFGRCSAEDHKMIQSILSAVVLAIDPLSPSIISQLLGLKCNTVLAILELIQSLLVLYKDPKQPVQPFHKSFPDFITDPIRCIDSRFYLSPDHHNILALHCISFMNELPAEIGLLVPYYFVHIRVPEAQELCRRIARNGVYEPLEYAHRSWYQHLTTTKHPTADVISVLSHFLEQKFIFWGIVLNDMRRVDLALGVTVGWLKEVCISIYLACLAPDIQNYI